MAASIHGVSTNKAVFGRGLINVIGVILYFFIAFVAANFLTKLLTSPYNSSVVKTVKEIDEYNKAIEKTNKEIDNFSIQLSKAKDNYSKIQNLLLNRNDEMNQWNMDARGE